MSAFDERVAAFAAGERFFVASPDPMVAVDAAGRVRAVNPAWRAMLAGPEETVCWQAPASLIEVVVAEDAARLRAFVAGPVGAMQEFRARGAGEFAPLLQLKLLFAEPDGLICLRGRDVTVERRRADHAALIERASGVGSWEVDLGARALHWSPQTFRIFEAPYPGPTPNLDEALAFYPEDARIALTEAVQRLIDEGVGFDMESPMITATGRRRWVRSRAIAEVRDGVTVRAHGVVEDVTEARLAREHMARLAAVAAGTRSAAAILDPSLRIEWVNPAFERMTGYALAEAVGHRPDALLCWEAGADPAALAAIEARLAAGAPASVELLNRRKDGGDCWVSMDIQPMRDETGALTGFSTLMHDVTARRADALRLREAQAEAVRARRLLANAIESLADGFALYDADDRLVICNSRYRDIFPNSRPVLEPGHRFEDILRYGLSRREYDVPEAEHEAWLATRLQERREGDVLREQQMTDGRWVRTAERRTPDGGMVGLRIDVTELHRERMRLSDIIAATRLGTWELCLATGNMVVNARFAEMLGYRYEDMRRINIALLREMIHPEDMPRLHSAREAHLAGETDSMTCEFRMHGAEGWVWILTRGRVASRTADGAPLTMVGMHQDVTARKEHETTLQEARARAEQANATKSQFLANMSHEIRTPMNGVLGVAQVLEQRLEDPDARALLGVIRESGEALLTIINDILDLSKIEAGRLTLEQAPFRPDELARRIESLHGPKALERGIGFTMTLEGEADRPRIGDAHRLLQVMHNLVGNAIKFTETGSVAMTLACPAGGPVTLTVRDTGIGMTPEQQATVFEDFLQADATTTRRFGGTGLGMAIVRRLVSAMGGDIALDSSVGVGTTVILTLPLPVAGPETPSGAGDAPDALAARAASVAGARVLIADDNEVNRFVIDAMLGALGVETVVADGGREAIRLALSQSFDLIMMDISMPDIDGPTALAAIRARQREQGVAATPVIAVTAHAMPQEVAAFLAAGFDGHVAKPLRPDLLHAAMLSHLPDRARAAPV